MKSRITDAQVHAAIERLQGRGERITWRRVREELITEWGAAGRTDRLRAFCASRRSAGEPALGPELLRLRELLLEAEQAREAALQRALRAEEREVRHQDRWAAEIHSLRQAVADLQQERARRHDLEIRLLRLQQEIQGHYARCIADGAA